MKERLILEVIPCDEWVSAVEIADKTGLHKTAVAGCARNLLQFIERKRMRSRNRVYLYKRIE
ncbi:hypothetical protein ES703_61134 [subsurface metagenome]